MREYTFIRTYARKIYARMGCGAEMYFDMDQRTRMLCAKTTLMYARRTHLVYMYIQHTAVAYVHTEGNTAKRE